MHAVEPPDGTVSYSMTHSEGSGTKLASGMAFCMPSQHSHTDPAACNSMVHLGHRFGSIKSHACSPTTCTCMSSAMLWLICLGREHHSSNTFLKDRTSKSPSIGIPKELAAKSHSLAADAPARQYKRTYKSRGIAVFSQTAGPAAMSRCASDASGGHGRYLHCRPRCLQSLNGTPAQTAPRPMRTHPSRFNCKQRKPVASTPHHSTLSPPPPLSANG